MPGHVGHGRTARLVVSSIAPQPGSRRASAPPAGPNLAPAPNLRRGANGSNGGSRASAESGMGQPGAARRALVAVLLCAALVVILVKFGPGMLWTLPNWAMRSVERIVSNA